MPALRCALCGINFPAGFDALTGVCPLHPEQKLTWSPDLTADPDWQVSMERLKKLIDPDEEEPDLIPLIRDGKVFRRKKRLFIRAWLVWPAVRRRMTEGELIRVGLQVYEILAYVDDDRAYWVRKFSMTPPKYIPEGWGG